jgi:hypothetical protein
MQVKILGTRGEIAKKESPNRIGIGGYLSNFICGRDDFGKRLYLVIAQALSLSALS